MFNISANGIIELHRGDTFDTPIYVNLGTTLRPSYYDMLADWKEITAEEKEDYIKYKFDEKDNKYYGYVGDVIYFAVLEPNSKWENALIKKSYTALDFDKEDQSVTLRFDTEDTEYLLPGNYYYEVKLYRCVKSCHDGFDRVDTIIGRTKFVIME